MGIVVGKYLRNFSEIFRKFPETFPKISGDPKTGKSYYETGKQNFDVWDVDEQFYDHP